MAADAGPIEAEFPSEINGCKKLHKMFTHHIHKLQIGTVACVL